MSQGLNKIIDYINKKIIQKLSLDGRFAYSELAKELNISNSLVHQRIKKMQEAGIIKGFSIKLDAKAMGYETITYTGIATKEARYSYSIAERLKEIPEVVECHFVSGKYALFLKIVATNNEEFRKILYEKIHIIEGVGSTDSFISFGSAFEKEIPIL
ncbi:MULTISPECIES: Lrp/AsnC family transcriptional regulator [Flavobacterium]|uniref:Winged helix-turn-helix transcriptional regulator n=2 Tax=Flavobacterium TaxID=237 RepID=A0AA94F2L3_9FLAO|nr:MULTISPECIES: Lrp/AsnC ligand binding domain-containing protein [Flavobacterium]OXA83156.1 AsnC family transcriptional regulator [Flavobacterium columnare NBRC 100251 = ATCC 23463]AMA49994.1 AsnC family transcriptional regulator [Flavobacterium covae]AND64477.1 AsnC family transcriptional regulator [Flavobacterium covae]MCH4829186.1 Lrp/AsnC ligand binding domain-containing protein [Flavobacterium columnare]MCH4833963.1 Lrp/AsnC ligand binding domain-containing protein [Flavobacterium colum